MTTIDQPETRQQVCHDCIYQIMSVPIACELVTKDRRGQALPCSGKLRQMMQTAGATCPHPDPEWAARWNAAEPLPVPSTIIGDVTAPAARGDAQSGSASVDPGIAEGMTDPEDGLTSEATDGTRSGMTRCQRATANRKVDPAELERRVRDRAARRGNSNRAFHVHRIDIPTESPTDPARAVPNA